MKSFRQFWNSYLLGYLFDRGITFLIFEANVASPFDRKTPFLFFQANRASPFDRKTLFLFFRVIDKKHRDVPVLSIDYLISTTYGYTNTWPLNLNSAQILYIPGSENFVANTGSFPSNG